MASIDAAGGGTPLSAALAEGVRDISYNQSVTFNRYLRRVLPLDGYVFWVRAALIEPDALNNTLVVKGSLHVHQDSRQEETQNFTVNQIVFTALSEVEDLNTANPGELFMGEFEGNRFAFSSRGGFYRQAHLYHYRGQAVYSYMRSQVIVDDLAQLDTARPVVSNSLPLWLSLNEYDAFYGFRTTGVTLFPSFLVPDNIDPPFGAVHIYPDRTTAIAGAPRLSPTFSHSQLVEDTVKITLYGTRNFSALDFVDCVNQWSLDYDLVGIMNQPTIRDEKMTQNEMNVLAQKKVVEYRVNYYQERVNDIARQLILNAVPTYHFQ